MNTLEIIFFYSSVHRFLYLYRIRNHTLDISQNKTDFYKRKELSYDGRTSRSNSLHHSLQ